MGIIFLFLIIIVGVSFLSYHGTASKRIEIKRSNMFGGMVVSSMVFIIITGIIFIGSYSSYIKLEAKLVTIEQYKESIELYAKKGVAEFKSGAPTELTDLKYNNYQMQIGEMIRAMRDTIIEYNTGVVSRKLRKDNWFFNWVTLIRDDMKPVKMSDYLK